MKLSNLVFECVKNVKYLDDQNFTYNSFLSGEYDTVDDYSNSINNVFTPLNTAIHRLSDRNKIGSKVESVNFPNNENILDISSFKNDVKRIVNVFTLNNGQYNRCNFRELGKDKLYLSNVTGNKTIYVEYLQDIPHFKKEDFYFSEGTQKDVDLRDYGIDETMCSYIIEFVKGYLFEQISPELANAHRIYAEQYFNDLEERTPFNQTNITNVIRYR